MHLNTPFLAEGPYTTCNGTVHTKHGARRSPAVSYLFQCATSTSTNSRVYPSDFPINHEHVSQVRPLAQIFRAHIGRSDSTYASIGSIGSSLSGKRSCETHLIGRLGLRPTPLNLKKWDSLKLVFLRQMFTRQSSIPKVIYKLERPYPLDRNTHRHSQMSYK